MTTSEKQITIIKEWLSFSLKNQMELQKECDPLEFPTWNKGYLEALRDLEEIINDNK